MSKKIIQATGTVLYRITDTNEPYVCIIHRPRYDDWSWPKGKLHKRESLAHAAVRETAEETGYHVQLEAPLGVVSYNLDASGSDAVVSRGSQSTLRKEVTYWIAREIPQEFSNLRESTFNEPIQSTPEETDLIRWVSIDDAISTLTREDDKNLAREFARRVQSGQVPSSTLILVRAAKAISAKNWAGDTYQRPLTPRGASQAYALSQELSCYLPRRTYTTSLSRCFETLRPWSYSSGIETQVFAYNIEEQVAHHRAEHASSSQAQSQVQSREQSQSQAQSHKTSQKDILAAQFTAGLGDTIKRLQGRTPMCEVISATPSQLRLAARLLPELAENTTISKKIVSALSGKKSLKTGQAVAITIVPAAVSATNSLKSPSPEESQEQFANGSTESSSQRSHDNQTSCTISDIVRITPIVF